MFSVKMNWTSRRRPIRQGFNDIRRPSRSNELTYFHQGKKEKVNRFDQPIDAIRLQLADSNYINHKEILFPRSIERRQCLTEIHPWKSFDQESSIHSISTIETDFVHQRVSTIHTYPSNETFQLEQPEQPQQEEETSHEEVEQEQSNECRSCRMLIDIIDQQTNQIQQYHQQISEQADLLAKLARQYADLGHKSNEDCSN